jgi:quercetin dioxygenase-like cupin family protein
MHEVEPMLVYEFLYPALRTAVVVRWRPQSNMEVLYDTDMKQLPDSFLVALNCKYRVPCRRLADSDVAVVSLVLPPRSRTPEHRHPGHEILLPLKCDVTLHFGDIDAAVRANRGEFAHFHSFRTHWVENPTDEDAELLVLRVYE